MTQNISSRIILVLHSLQLQLDSVVNLLTTKDNIL